MPKLTDYDAVETLKPNISPNPARGMFGGPLGAYKVNSTMVGGVNPIAQKKSSSIIRYAGSRTSGSKGVIHDWSYVGICKVLG